MIEAYNDPINWNDKHPDVQNVNKEEHYRIYGNQQIKELDPKRNEGFISKSIQHFNMDVIKELSETPEEEISLSLATEHASNK